MSEYRWRVKRAWVGVKSPAGDLLGVIVRSGVVKACGHFCYLHITACGKPYVASGAEDRIYDFHSIVLESGDRVPEMTAYAVGWTLDGERFAFWSPTAGLVTLAGRADSKEPFAPIGLDELRPSAEVLLDTLVRLHPRPTPKPAKVPRPAPTSKFRDGPACRAQDRLLDAIRHLTSRCERERWTFAEYLDKRTSEIYKSSDWKRSTDSVRQFLHGFERAMWERLTAQTEWRLSYKGRLVTSKWMRENGALYADIDSDKSVHVWRDAPHKGWGRVVNPSEIGEPK